MFHMVNDTICDFEILSYNFLVFDILVCFTKVFLTRQPSLLSKETLSEVHENAKIFEKV